MKIRTGTVAGIFYPAEPARLNVMLEVFFSTVLPGGDAMGIVSPHAGYVYSGATASQAFGAIKPGFSGTFIVIGPSHRGFASCVSATDWDTPIGPVRADPDLAALTGLPVDEAAMNFGNENSLEVQMPFIRYRFPCARVVPVMMGHQTTGEIIRLTQALSTAVREYGEDVKIVASSDFSHYVPHEKAVSDDGYAISALTDSFDTKEFYSRITTRRITACGYGPICTMIETLRTRGATRCDLLSYTTSGETSGDWGQVVGYAALAVN